MGVLVRLNFTDYIPVIPLPVFVKLSEKSIHIFVIKNV